MKKASSIFFILLLSGTLLVSCSAAHKAKKCDCPTFGSQHKPAHPYLNEKDS